MTKTKINYSGYRNNLRLNNKCKDEILSLTEPKPNSEKSLDNWLKKCIKIYKKYNVRGEISHFKIDKSKVLIWGYKFNGKGNAVYFEKITDANWDGWEDIV